MTRRLLGCALAAILLCGPLGGCGTLSASPATSTRQTPAIALATAESLFYAAAAAERDAAAHGLLKGADALRAATVRRQAYQVLLGLREAKARGQTPDAAGLLVLVNQLRAFAGLPPVITPNVPAF